MRRWGCGATQPTATPTLWKPTTQPSGQWTTRLTASCCSQPPTTKPWRCSEPNRKSSSSPLWAIRTGCESVCLLLTRGWLLLGATTKPYLCGTLRPRMSSLNITTIWVSSMTPSSIPMARVWRLAPKTKRLRFSIWEPKDRSSTTMRMEMLSTRLISTLEAAIWSAHQQILSWRYRFLPI